LVDDEEAFLDDWDLFILRKVFYYTEDWKDFIKFHAIPEIPTLPNMPA
jgi:hypothetical protein